MSSHNRPVKRPVTPTPRPDVTRPNNSRSGTSSGAGRRRPPTRAQRRHRNRVLWRSALAVVALLVALVVAIQVRSSSAGYNVTATAWKLPRQGGGTPVSLASLRGRPVVVNFFASWCKYCAAELPVFASDATSLRGRVDVVEVNTLETGNGTSFAQSFGLAHATTAVLSDVGGSQGSGLYQSLGGTGSLPMTAFYNAQGQVLGTHTGAYDAGTLASALKSYYGVTVPG